MTTGRSEYKGFELDYEIDESRENWKITGILRFPGEGTPVQQFVTADRSAQAERPTIHLEDGRTFSFKFERLGTPGTRIRDGHAIVDLRVEISNGRIHD